MRNLLAISLLFLVSVVRANEIQSLDFYTIESESITPLSESFEDSLVPNLLIDDISFEDIINTGQKIWEIIKANKPVFNHDRKWSSALPSGVKSGFDLSGWKMPKSHTYRYVATNLYGVNVVDLTFKVVYTYGGGKNGKGKYLMNVSVIPVSVDLKIGFTANVSIEVPEVFNMGTNDEPVAGMTLLVKTDIDTPFQTRDAVQVFTISGNGEIAQQ